MGKADGVEARLDENVFFVAIMGQDTSCEGSDGLCKENHFDENVRTLQTGSPCTDCFSHALFKLAHSSCFSLKRTKFCDRP